LLRPAAPKPRAAVWAAGLGVDLSTLSDGAVKTAAEEAAAAAAAAPAVTETASVAAPAAPVVEPAPEPAAVPMAPPTVAPVAAVAAAPVAAPAAAPVAAPAAAPAAVAVAERPSLESVLADLLVFDGSIGVALVDAQTGMVLGEAGSAVNLGLSAAGASVILRARLDTNKALGRSEQIADVLITLSSQVQIIHPLSENPNLFLFLIGDKAKASLAMARYKAAEADHSIRL
jgi:hypothetical protein